MTEQLGRMFLKLADRYGTRSNWRGYTYNDEMRAQAVLQLSQIGLQFDESKSLNPFAYYTAAVTNSFTRVLNIEKKNQNIRDDILQENGLNPSFTRQNEEVFKEDKEKLAEFYKNMRRPKADY
jgi:ABC-type dipeptide/oligopeptide/nickel transport system ATPase subunit